MSITAKLKDFLKKAWKAMEQPYGPYSPSPEVKRHLENKGWKYKPSLSSSPYMAATVYSIRTPEGEMVGKLFGGQEETARYLEAYEAAVKECAEKAAAPTQQGPEPK